ncbi:OsmC family protein [Halorubellus sp. JP-L1]|uniref:OsmC family protein n=1 Tax=Halorubellus sp. JP-L1 TaxID=2715753 RepID=UPI00140BE259|nr:OsmC family protein [Halorubellus sp. JP-L1]NHN41615.1 OsmC family protein [Halorubellus sp. JP-L1]
MNGVDVSKLEQTVEAVTDDSTVGQFQFRAETEWTDALRSMTRIDDFDQAGETIHTRTFEIEGDEPEEILGDRTGPNAVELLLSAIGSCLTVGYAAHAAGMGIELDSLRLELDGDVNLQGFLGISEDVRPGYEHVNCTVYVESDASPEELEELREVVEETSPLLDNVRNGVSVETEQVSL